MLDNLVNELLEFLPSGISIALIVVSLVLVNKFLHYKYRDLPNRNTRLQWIMIGLTFCTLIIIILILPVNDTTRGQVLSLIGILLSATIALSSTTFIGNLMAGIMLKVLRSFRSGDFISINGHFGRISERGLFHIEIQTPERDLTTLPNLYLVTHAYNVIRTSGTMVYGEVSLGYDAHIDSVKPLLLQAAEDTGLTETHVSVMELGDYSVTYRVTGLLCEVKLVIGKRSELKENMLKYLHEGGIEIVSPKFINSRVFQTQKSFIPKKVRTRNKKEEARDNRWDIIFDKAEEAESIEKIQYAVDVLNKKIEEISGLISDSSNNREKEKLKNSRERMEKKVVKLLDIIKQRNPS